MGNPPILRLEIDRITDIEIWKLQQTTVEQDNERQVVALVGSRKMLKEVEKNYSIFSEAWSGFESGRFRTIADARRWIEKELE